MSNKSSRELLRSARRDAGFSVAQLAARAHVAESTIKRIEAGRVDPTTGMLSKLIQATGGKLTLSYAPPPKAPTASELSLGALARKWRHGGAEPDLRQLRGFLDELTFEPSLIPAAIKTKPITTGSKILDALLAGVAEKLADDHGLPRPIWTKQIPSLKKTWSRPATPRMRAQQSAATPPQLKARGFILDETSLWRERKTAGA